VPVEEIYPDDDDDYDDEFEDDTDNIGNRIDPAERLPLADDDEDEGDEIDVQQPLHNR
jgi:hypothetical protein